MNESGPDEVAGVFVNEKKTSQFAMGKRALEIFLAERFEAAFIVGSKYFRISNIVAGGEGFLIQSRHHPSQVAQFSRPFDCRVGAENFLDQRRTSSRHAHNEDWRIRWATQVLALTKE